MLQNLAQTPNFDLIFKIRLFSDHSPQFFLWVHCKVGAGKEGAM